MDEVYRDHRIATKLVAGIWTARISHVRGAAMPLTAQASEVEGAAVCAARARRTIDRYLDYLANGERD